MAIKEQDKVFYEEASNGDKIINLPISRVNNIEGIGRSISTAYVVGDVVYVDNNKKVALKCTQAGTTSNSELNVGTANIGDTVTDGSVVWQVCNRTSDVTSVNGKTGDVVVYTLPVGTVIAYTGVSTPEGFLACNGASVSRTTYKALFDVVGTASGVGDGSTTFNLPNMNNGSFLEGSDSPCNYKSAGLPNITGKFAMGKAGYYGDGTLATGAFTVAKSSTLMGNAAVERGETGEFSIDASRSSSVYGNSTTVQPKSVTVKYCIKY